MTQQDRRTPPARSPAKDAQTPPERPLTAGHTDAAGLTDTPTSADGQTDRRTLPSFLPTAALTAAQGGLRAHGDPRGGMGGAGRGGGGTPTSWEESGCV